ncbi:hypothetical protein QTP88_008264 [Uroleucon formosanum]
MLGVRNAEETAQNREDWRQYVVAAMGLKGLVCIFKSLWRLEFVMYQGAEETRRRQMDWKACIDLVLEGFAAPHNWMPYVHGGLSRDL